MNPGQIYRLWQAEVIRWHHSTDHKLRNSGDTIQAHQCRVAQLLDTIFPDWTREEMRQAIWHDAPESWTGDPSYTAKQRHRVIKDAHDWAEADTAMRYDLPANCGPRVKLCDGVDCILFAASRNVDMGRDGWPEHIADVKADAWRLNVGPIIEGLFMAGRVD